MFASPALAEITRARARGDPHLQTVGYAIAAEVVALHVTAGFALTVQFAPDERIETVTVGRPGAWACRPQARRPAGGQARRAAPPTNMTVFTDQRTYNFTLWHAAGLGCSPTLSPSPTPPRRRPLRSPPKWGRGPIG